MPQAVTAMARAANACPREVAGAPSLTRMPAALTTLAEATMAILSN